MDSGDRKASRPTLPRQESVPPRERRFSAAWGWSLFACIFLGVTLVRGAWNRWHASKTPARSPQFLVDINLASREELQALPEIGPSLARRIALYREDHGRFLALEELLNVRGLGPRTLEQLRPLLTVNEQVKSVRTTRPGELPFE